MIRTNRRKFIQGCCAGIAAMNGARLGNFVFADEGGPPRDILISVFLRGGMDALSYLIPYTDSDYHIARPVLGMEAGVLDIDGQFGMHPALAPLKEIMDAGHLALVMACGSPNPSRSHFDAQDNMDRGNGETAYYQSGGWLARHLAQFPSSSIFQGISYGSTVTTSFEGFPKALALSNPGSFSLRGSGNQDDDLRRALRRMYAADTLLADTGLATLDAVDVMDRANPDTYIPGNGVVYPNDSTADAFETLAQLIRLDIGLQAATVDLGGWDTHESQANNGNPTTGTLANNLTDLAEALAAFWNDLSDFHGRLTITVISEFGRRVKENNNRGTDHGRAGVMTVISSSLVRGGLFGTWPGLSNDQLTERVDLTVTTDYRTVFTETLLARCGHTQASVGGVFPDFPFTNPLGLFGVTQGFASSSSIRQNLLGKLADDDTYDVNGDGATDAADLSLAAQLGR